MILLITFEEDPQGDALVDAFDALGFQDYFRLDLGRVLERNAVELQLADGKWGGELHFRDAPGLRLDPAALRTIYLRRFAHPALQRKLEFPSEEDFEISQAYTAVLSWVQSLPPHLFPLGHPGTQRAGENKFKQLSVAAACGLRTLPTLFSTRPDTIARFAEAHGEVVVKTLGRQSVYSDAEQGTDSLDIYGAAVISADDLTLHLAELTHTQLFLQKAIRAKAEWRITSLPGAHVACRIDTSSIPDGGIDYRPHIPSLPHEIRPLPDGLSSRLDAFLKQMGLSAGCFDFAETSEGEFFFFECNPVGEWWWIERLTEHPISHLFASCLIAHHRVVEQTD